MYSWNMLEAACALSLTVGIRVRDTIHGGKPAFDAIQWVFSGHPMAIQLKKAYKLSATRHVLACSGRGRTSAERSLL